jgi:hypothetical protein
VGIDRYSRLGVDLLLLAFGVLLLLRGIIATTVKWETEKSSNALKYESAKPLISKRGPHEHFSDLFY